MHRAFGAALESSSPSFIAMEKAASEKHRVFPGKQGFFESRAKSRFANCLGRFTRAAHRALDAKPFSARKKF
jgi:hypothetical protein